MVERNLAKVEVESSRLFSRSRFFWIQVISSFVVFMANHLRGDLVEPFAKDPLKVR